MNCLFTSFAPFSAGLVVIFFLNCTKVFFVLGFFFLNPHPRTRLLLLERGEERERKVDVGETSISCLSYMPRLNPQPRHVP